MKKSSVFINVGRGNNVNENDLIKALKNKDISLAILDVFKKEPLPINHDFWNMENLIITPHISGYSYNNCKIIKIFWQNYNKFISWKKLKYQIDFEKWY